MPIQLDTRTGDFAERFRAFLGAKREASEDVEQAVRAIIAKDPVQGMSAIERLGAKP